MNMLLPQRKPIACRPCHERKVRCDASIRGLPCSRCVDRRETNYCQFINVRRPARRARRPNDRRQEGYANSTADGLLHQNSTGISVDPQETLVVPNTGPAATFQGSRATERRERSSVADIDPVLESPQTQINNNDGSVAEEDAHVRIYNTLSGGNQVQPVPSDSQSVPSGCEVIQYHDRLSHLSILCEAACNSRRPRLVRITIRNTDRNNQETEEHLAQSARDVRRLSEFKNLGKAELDYLEVKGAFDLPSKDVGLSLLSVYFDLVYPYAPILDRVEFLQQYTSGTYSTMLMHAILANVVPYVPFDIVSQMGFSSRMAAMKCFHSKAALLYDVSCEKPHSQLELLQVSLILGTLQFSFTLDKDFHFWLHNAVRIGTKMGLHRNDFGTELKPSELRLWRRIWWIIYLAASGLQNIRLLNNLHYKTQPLEEADWDEDLPDRTLPIPLFPSTRSERLFQMEMCRLARIGSDVLNTLQSSKCPSDTLNSLFGSADDLAALRNALPLELSLNGTSLIWRLDYMWSCLIFGSIYRFECLIYREILSLHKDLDEQALKSLCNKLLGAMFEIDTIVGRILMWDAAKYFPLGFSMIVIMVVALHIQMKITRFPGQSEDSLPNIYIPQGLRFLRKAQERWASLKWTVKLLDRILDQTGICSDHSDNLAPGGNSDPDNIVDSPELNFLEANTTGAGWGDSDFGFGGQNFTVDLDACLGNLARGDFQDQWATDAVT